MSRAKEILKLNEEVTGAQLKTPVRNRKHTKYFKCQSCGRIYSNPTGILAPNGIQEPEISFSGEAIIKCPKCKKPLEEIRVTSAVALSGVHNRMGRNYMGNGPGGFHGGAYQ